MTATLTKDAANAEVERLSSVLAVYEIWRRKDREEIADLRARIRAIHEATR